MNLQSFIVNFCMRISLCGGIALFFLIGGCTELERSGYSAIPQNSPGSWELNPYGDLRN